MYPNKHFLFRVLSVLMLGLVLSVAVAHANDLVVCKKSDTVAAGVPFSFTDNFTVGTINGTTTFTVNVGDCVTFLSVGEGSIHRITEAVQTGTVISQITVDPSANQVSVDLTLRTVTVSVVTPIPAKPTTVTFFNKKTGNQGCTPGFWKQDFHFSFWVTFSPTQTVDSVFTGVLPDLSDETLLTALQGGGGPGLLGAEKILLRAAVAALLNSTSGSISFPFATAAIINAVNTAIATGDRDTILNLATELDNANNGTGGCPLP